MSVQGLTALISAAAAFLTAVAALLHSIQTRRQLGAKPPAAGSSAASGGAKHAGSPYGRA